MSTNTLATINAQVRRFINETATTIISDAELNSIIYDGYKEVCSKGLCYETRISKSTTASERLISLYGNNIIKIHNIEYRNASTDGGWGILSVIPQTFGYNDIDIVNTTDKTGPPKYWFKWGEYLVLDPIPDVSTYNLYIYASCYPSTIANIPNEFQECIYLYALTFSCIKIRRWGDAINSYNRYIKSIQEHHIEYINKTTDFRASHELPLNVIMKDPNSGE